MIREHRNFISMAVHTGFTYAIEGATTPKSCSVWTVEKKDIMINHICWFMVRSMHKPRPDAGDATLRDNIYIVRGFDWVTTINTADVFCLGRGR